MAKSGFIVLSWTKSVFMSLQVLLLQVLECTAACAQTQIGTPQTSESKLSSLCHMEMTSADTFHIFSSFFWTFVLTSLRPYYLSPEICQGWETYGTSCTVTTPTGLTPQAKIMPGALIFGVWAASSMRCVPGLLCLRHHESLQCYTHYFATHFFWTYF